MRWKIQQDTRAVHFHLSQSHFLSLLSMDFRAFESLDGGSQYIYPGRKGKGHREVTIKKCQDQPY